MLNNLLWVFNLVFYKENGESILFPSIDDVLLGGRIVTFEMIY